MTSKTLVIECDQATARVLAGAIRVYVQAAYPPGGSACAQAARAALLDTASLCAAHRQGELRLRRRQTPQIRAALRWYCGDEGPGEARHRAVLSDLITHIAQRR